ncbi:TPA: hypothetical protein DEG21_06180 [Patescibacteria group bacterium]|nr:hypothetical protein [Candidatus Gracilibacteria bacterium]
MLDSPWNQTNEILPSNIIRVKTWKDILEILENPKNNLSKQIPQNFQSSLLVDKIRTSRDCD